MHILVNYQADYRPDWQIARHTHTHSTQHILYAVTDRDIMVQ